MPRVQVSFNNIFKTTMRASVEVRDNTFEEANTIERVLRDEGGKFSKLASENLERGTRIDLMST